MNPWKRKEVIGDCTLYLGDCLEILPTLEKVDAVITDPPYSEKTHKGHDASANGHAGIGKDSAKRNELGYSALNDGDIAAAAKTFCMASSGWIVWMHDHVQSPTIHDQLLAHGRYVFAPLPFLAPGSRVRLSGDGPSSWTIWITVARTAAQARWGTLPGGYVASEGWRDREHMGGKPVALMNRLVMDYSRKGDTVTDPFMGGGTTGVACANLGRKFIGIEIEPKYFDIACERITNAYRQERLLA